MFEPLRPNEYQHEHEHDYEYEYEYEYLDAHGVVTNLREPY